MKKNALLTFIFACIPGAGQMYYGYMQRGLSLITLFCASFMLGAVGVQMGTRFLVADECTVHENYKQKILDAKDIDTLTTGKRLGHPVRALKNAFTRDYFAKEYDSSISNEELEKLGAGALRLAAREGDVKKGCFMAGQVAAMVKKKQPAAEIILEVMAEAEKLLAEANQWVK